MTWSPSARSRLSRLLPALLPRLLPWCVLVLVLALSMSGAQPRLGPRLQVDLLDPPVLSPGRTVPLDVAVSNPGPRRATISSIEVVLTGVDQPCRAADFALQPGRFPAFDVPAGVELSLSQAGVQRSQWPTLAMIDLPLDQSGCRHSRLTLRLLAHGLAR